MKTSREKAIVRGENREKRRIVAMLKALSHLLHRVGKAEGETAIDCAITSITSNRHRGNDGF